MWGDAGARGTGRGYWVEEVSKTGVWGRFAGRAGNRITVYGSHFRVLAAIHPLFSISESDAALALLGGIDPTRRSPYSVQILRLPVVASYGLAKSKLSS